MSDNNFMQEARNAVIRALKDGTWREISWMAEAVRAGAFNLMQQEAQQTAGDTEARVTAEEEGPGWPEWATWRVQLPGSTPSVVYFTRKPQYAELKAFAAAAGVAVDACRAEERV